MALPKDIPTIPPRPARPARRPDRSRSPSQDRFAPSPLSRTVSNQSGGLGSSDQSSLSSSLPPRSPSVTLPSIGQEGSEYASVVDDPSPARVAGDSFPPSHTETRNVGSDVQLHAPKPGLPTSSAKARIATVTRTDSQQAAAAGIGKAHGDDVDPYSRPLKTRTSFASQESSASTERPGSVQPGESEHGIPEIGQRVPMYPNAGDVQAPSPSPFGSAPSTGIGYHSDGQLRAGRHHRRLRSGQEQLPPGSYGLHGHGTPVQDRFEKAWYEKHPEALEREEHGEYGPGIGGGRGEWALSSDDLNKIVRETAHRGAGLGTAGAVSTPDEQIGYMASEEYASRLASSHSPSTPNFPLAHSNHSQPHVESPLRKASMPTEEGDGDKPQVSSSSPLSGARPSEHAVEVDGDEDVIHVDPPSRSASKMGGAGYDPPTEELGPHGGNTEEEGGWIDELGYGTPILASDEVAKERGLEFLQPAIEPHQEMRGGEYHATPEPDSLPSYRNGSRSSSAANSRPSSRPGSISGSLAPLSRFISYPEREELGTPLEDVEEYEPLFPEDDSKAEKKAKRPPSAVERLKRPDQNKHRFPSQDIWEDAPSSAKLMATVSTPDLPQDDRPVQPAERETAESLNPSEVTDRDEGPDAAEEAGDVSKSAIPSHLRNEVNGRPSLKQRFPSRDIWEDTPASLQLQTTVSTPQLDDTKSPPGAAEQAMAGGSVERQERRGGELASSPTNQPQVPPRPAKVAAGDDHKDQRQQPRVPLRPAARTRRDPAADVVSRSNSSAELVASPMSERKAPLIPEKPKPQVPARPARVIARDSTEHVPLAKTTSKSSAKSGEPPEDAGSANKDPAAPSPKPKPAVPIRPSGGKLAAFKAGFMSDLDKRLQIGPQATKPPKEKEVSALADMGPKESVPLTDARKGRARGPARRKPAASPSAVMNESPQSPATASLSLVQAHTIWHITDDGEVNVHDANDAVVDTSVPSQNSPPVAKLSEDPVTGAGLVQSGAGASASEATERELVEAAEGTDKATATPVNSSQVETNAPTHASDPSYEPANSGASSNPGIVPLSSETALHDEEDVSTTAKPSNPSPTEVVPSQVKAPDDEVVPSFIVPPTPAVKGAGETIADDAVETTGVEADLRETTDT
ncbi:MAG: hypothetical protein M1838_005927 [Thelocarpon superellum]|nr:MAG: hypothetical protein M1838_005927 [Thelocarpon superellum]